MGEESGRVIASIADRIRLRQDVADLLGALLAAEEQAPVEQQHQRLLAYGRDLLAVLPRFLESAEPRAISRLGALLAAYPDRPAAVTALRRVALQAANSDARRMSSMVILEQWLGQVLGVEFFAGLRDPAQVAVDALAGASGDRNMLLAYLAALEEQHPNAPYTLLTALANSSTDPPLDLLRLLAQHEDEELSKRALALLVGWRDPAALLALRELLFVLSPLRREGVERLLRKLSMSGRELPPFAAQPPGLRALQTPFDGQGFAATWFIVPGASADQVQLLSVLVSDERGISDAFGGDSFAVSCFPPPGPSGAVYHDIEPLAVVRTDGEPDADAAPDGEPDADEPVEMPQAVDFMEVPFDYARSRLLDYQSLNWATGQPLPPEYRLLHDIIWRFGPPEPPTLRLPRPAPRTRAAELATLFDTVPFRSWFLRGDGVYRSAEQLRARPDAPLQQAAAALAADFFTTRQSALMSHRLQLSAEWLVLSGDPDKAALAVLASRLFLATPPAENPFALLLAERGLQRALEEISSPAR